MLRLVVLPRSLTGSPCTCHCSLKEGTFSIDERKGGALWDKIDDDDDDDDFEIIILPQSSNDRLVRKKDSQGRKQIEIILQAVSTNIDIQNCLNSLGS